jgi:hypothetical protein
MNEEALVARAEVTSVPAHPRKPFHIGRASELSGSDRALYRFFEMIPGTLAWGTRTGDVCATI